MELNSAKYHSSEQPATRTDTNSEESVTVNTSSTATNAPATNAAKRHICDKTWFGYSSRKQLRLLGRGFQATVRKMGKLIELSEILHLAYVFQRRGPSTVQTFAVDSRCF